MNKSFFASLLLILVGCGSFSAKTKPSNNADFENIIGSSIKIGTLEIAQYDFPKNVEWATANVLCSRLGAGWRLPTKEELNILYETKYGSADGLYWSSSDYAGYAAWVQYFGDGHQFVNNKSNVCWIRAVRTFR